MQFYKQIIIMQYATVIIKYNKGTYKVLWKCREREINSSRKVKEISQR